MTQVSPLAWFRVYLYMTVSAFKTASGVVLLDSMISSTGIGIRASPILVPCTPTVDAYNAPDVD
jgi:hypothetical protein